MFKKEKKLGPTVDPDVALSGPIAELLLLNGEEKTWFKTEIYNSIKEEELRITFVVTFNQFLKDEKNAKARMEILEAIRGQRPITLRWLLKKRFIPFLEKFQNKL